MTRTLKLKPPVALGVILAVAALAPLAAQEPFEGAEFQRRRQAWFEEQRAYPNAEVDWERLFRARQLFTARSGNRGFASIADAVSGSWTPMGPNGFFGLGYWDSGPQLDAGRVDAIALHPTAAGTMFVASPNGGLWSTLSGGASWNPLFDAQCTLLMSTVKIDPVNPSIMYAAAAFSSGAGCAIFRSTDGGASWASFNGNLGFNAYSGPISEFYIDPASAGSTTSTTLIFTFSSSGIYRSSNSGTTWLHPFLFGRVHSIVALPNQPSVLFAGVADNATTASTRSGLYRSVDNGVTWTQLSSGAVDFTSTGRIQLAVSPAQPHSVWILAGSNASSFQFVSKWDNVTNTLTQQAAAGIDLSSGGRTHFGTQARYDLAIAVDPTNASRIYIAGVRAFRSTDGGATFAVMGTEIHCDWHTIVISSANARQLYAGTDGGVFSSTDGGDTWTSRNYGLAISMYYPGISQHPTDPNVVLGGLQDNGSLLANGTQVSNGVQPGGDGGFAAINYSSPSTIWTTCQWMTSGPCLTKRISTATGFSYPNVRNGIVITDRAQFLPPLVMDPVSPTTLYFGTMRLYKTVNDGVLWTALSADLSKGTGSIKTIAPSQSDPQTVYVGTSDGNVQVTRDGGTTWTLITTGLPNRTVTDIAVDRTNAARAVVTFSGLGTPHAYITSDAGVTWTSASGSLADIPVNAVVMVDEANHFFVGNDVGVFETTDAGLTWTNTPGGLPYVVVNDLSYNTTTKQLVAATYGRGLFKYSLLNPSAVLRGDVNRDGTVNAFDALLIQQALVGLQLPGGQTSMPHGDANCDGKLDTADALIVLRFSVGLATAGACVGTNR
jgi:photosystem II stability/assembly factor-like uncharacterized protein